MPETMVDIFDKGSSLGNVFNKAVSSADEVNAEQAEEGAASDGTNEFIPFQEILGQEMTKNPSGGACSPQKGGKSRVKLGVAGEQEESLMIPLVVGGKQQAARRQVGKEGVKNTKQQKDDKMDFSAINEHILNSIISANTPLQLATGLPTNPQRIEGECGLQKDNTIIGNGANVASTLFANTEKTMAGIGVWQGSAFSVIGAQDTSATINNKNFLGMSMGEMGNSQASLSVNENFLGMPMGEMGNSQAGLSVPPFPMGIQGHGFSVSDAGEIINRLLGESRSPIINVSQENEQIHFAPGTVEGAKVKVVSIAQENSSINKTATTASQKTKEESVVGDFYREESASTAAPASQHGNEQDASKDSPENPNIFDFLSLDASEKKTPDNLFVTANTLPGQEPRQPNYLELQQKVSVSHENNAIQSFSSEGVTSYLYHDKTGAAGQTQVDIMDQLFQRISLSTHGGRSEIKMYLTPPELGKVEIHFVEEGDEIKAKIFVENAEVKATIENNVHHLRESIASSGIGVHKLEVYLQNEDTNKQKSLEDFNANNFGRQNQGQRHTGQGKNYFEEGKTDDSVVNIESGANASNFAIDYIS